MTARKNISNKRDAAKIGAGKPGPGRPRGVPNKLTRTLKEQAAEHGEAAIGVLAGIMVDSEQPGSVRVAAADRLLDRGFGRPAQTIEAEVSITSAPNSAELDAIYSKALSKVEADRQRVADRSERLRGGKQ